jgi:hypothetical protein
VQSGDEKLGFPLLTGVSHLLMQISLLF